MTLSIDDGSVDGCTVLVLAGEIDLVDAPDLIAVVSSCVHAGSRALVLDLGDVGFLDSSGIGAIVAGARSLRAVGGELALAGATGPVERVLTLAGLADLLPVRGTVAEAVEALSAG